MRVWAWGLTLVCLWWPWGDSRAAAVQDRRNWIFEQLGEPPLPTPKGRGRSQAQAGATHLGDTLSLQGTGTVDLRLFELRAKGGTRLFPDGSSGRKGALSPLGYHAGAEIARSFATDDRHFGRLAVEYLRFFPEATQWLGLGLGTGILETAEVPWALSLYAYLRFSLSGTGNQILLGVATKKVIHASTNQQLHLGGRFTWSQRGRELPGPGRYENILFSLGPFLEWVTPVGVGRLGAALRIWLDREVTAVNQSYQPSEFTPPDLSLTWTFPL